MQTATNHKAVRGEVLLRSSFLFELRSLVVRPSAAACPLSPRPFRPDAPSPWICRRPCRWSFSSPWSPRSSLLLPCPLGCSRFFLFHDGVHLTTLTMQVECHA